MSSVRAGRGGRGAASSPFEAPAGPKTTRPPFASRARASNQVRFNGTPRGSSERGGRGTSRGGHAQRGGRGRGRGNHTPTTPSPLAAPTPQPTNASSSFPDRFQALKKQREQERTQAIAQGFLADPDKPRTLAEAITPVGTCPDMCPEFERLERVVQKDVWAPEHDDAGAPAEHRMVKKFRRAAAGIDEQLPSDLRPPVVLKMTVDYLFDHLVANAPTLGSVHHFVWDRTRAIRNDFSIQQITKPADVEIAIECYERIARFHILSLHQLAVPEKPYDKYDAHQEREQLDRTLLSLMQYYDDFRDRVQCRNEAEFRAYLIVFQVQGATPDLYERVNTWPTAVKSDRRVRTALDLNAAASNIVNFQGPLKPEAAYPVAREDYAQFFDLVRSNKVSYLMACVSEVYFKLVRQIALNAIWRGFKGQVFEFTSTLTTKILGFDDAQQAEEFCRHFGLTFKESTTGGEKFLDLDSVKGKPSLTEIKGLETQTFSENLVEVKRMGRNFSAVIDGYTVVEAQNAGLIDVTYDTQMEETAEDQAEEDPDSLFVPEGPPKSTLETSGTTLQSSPFASIFASTKASGGGQPTAIFSQPKPVTSSFGQPSTSTSFSFGKPSGSSTPPQAPPSAIPSATSIFTSSKSESVNPPSSLFTSASRPTPSNSTDQPTKPSVNPFAIANPVVTGEKALPKSSPFETGSVFNSTTAPSISRAPSTQELPKPSFNFSSTSNVSAHASEALPPPSKSPFSFSSSIDHDNDLLKPKTTTTEPAQASGLLFSAPHPAASEAQSSPVSSSNDTPNLDPVTATANSSPFGSRLPQFNFSQPSQPKKPSPLSQSFSSDEKDENPAQQTSASDVQNSTPPASTFDRPSGPAVSQNSVIPPPEILKSKDEILEQLAREVVLDADRGLIRQFVEYHARQTVMGVYDELYMESIRELADTFRRETLSYRYGKRWREICWRRRLARQGRERRKRAKKDQSAREQQRKLAAEKDAVDDFLRSTNSAVHLGASLSSQNQNPLARTHTAHDSDQTTAREARHKRLRSLDKTDVQTPIVEKQAATPRSSFLGFSMLGSQNRPTISSTPSRSSYFRLKALGINPGEETNGNTQAKKRSREDSEEAVAGETSPPSKKSHTPPATMPLGSARSLASAKHISKSLVRIAAQAEPSSKSKAQQEDDELFARARAVRQAMADSSAFYRSESQKIDAQSKKDMARSLSSPSMERAREAARIRSARPGAASPDVPAYRLRESRFVPRTQYGLAIEKARQKIESRSPSQLSTPGATRSSPHMVGHKSVAASAPTAPLTLSFASLDGQGDEATSKMADFAALHKAPANSAWQHEPSFLVESVNPAIPESSFSGKGQNLESLAQYAINDYVNLGSDDETDDLRHGEDMNQSAFEPRDSVDTESFNDDGEGEDEADDESEENVGGYAQNPEDFEEEDYDDEELEVEEEEEYGDNDDEDDEEDSESDMSVSYHSSAGNVNSNIKAGTGTAEDAFELSD